jgi:hypothetical protein
MWWYRPCNTSYGKDKDGKIEFQGRLRQKYLTSEILSQNTSWCGGARLKSQLLRWHVRRITDPGQVWAKA